MGNKKSSMTPGSWWAKRTYGATFKTGPNIEDWEDKMQNQVLAELEEKEQLKNQKKKKQGKTWKNRNKKNRKYC